ncbi:hypothetical protein ACE6H2_018669 [Prunus campanulata]
MPLHRLLHGIIDILDMILYDILDSRILIFRREIYKVHNHQFHDRLGFIMPQGIIDHPLLQEVSPAQGSRKSHPDNV